MNGFMNNLRNSFQRLMYGRYGFDQYSKGLIIVSFLLSIVATFTRFTLLILVSYIIFAYVIFRTMSKKIAKRSQENQIYYKLTFNLKTKLKNWKLVLVGTKTHTYYKCSSCKQLIRVPRGKGKICISCPKCKKEFIKKT